MPPQSYDPESPDEQEVALPSAPLVNLSDNAVLQPPLTHRGTGPGLIAFLPLPSSYSARQGNKPLDPEPVQKWAEEGFAVVGIVNSREKSGWSVGTALTKGVEALLNLKELDTRDKFAVYVYDPEVLQEVMIYLPKDTRLSCLVCIGSPAVDPAVPTFAHVPANVTPPAASGPVTVHRYSNSTPHFILPQAADYDPGAATLAHSRTLVFLRKILGGPIFDIEAVWEEHTYFEFEVRNLSKTLGTMVAEPYVNHVPTMTGGVGRKALTAFYRDHFIFANPADTELQLVSRTVGSDRIIDEFVFKLTHDRIVDWLLPGIPPSGKKLEIPFVAVVNVRGDRLYHEHIWWDQGTALMQAGIIPSHIPHPLPNGQQRLRLPVAGVECARLLVDETDGKSNEMMGSDWGLQGDA
ncbi:hypothetical protein D9758_001389 [Tetrapyrgos nigripes]|uniref:SnoaL-like domain-containing protein n=1 Tax=Tetrapyrgos nigripes TaxID=182062 RepID=A0A8H5GRP2_9AGAR|nr:hypothetical protein D9758_001389 [Tetrapyrgos nigripes]